MSPALAIGILAGGRGRRVGDADKGWLPRGDRAQIQWLLDRLDTGMRVRVVANRNLERYRSLVPEVVSDDDAFGPFAGPLGGLLRLLEDMPDSHVLSLPVDMGSVPAGLCARFATAVAADPEYCHVAVDADGPQPLVAAYPRQMARNARAALERGCRSVREWQAGLPVSELDFRPIRFGNLNTPADWVQ
ncbi:MAG TPA: molybdenum cofactor guanylyltransferase [Xanthomonadaceae bacterium]|nr:molybdenum cofactor guanylyltransferase [Xanthomonadaceae bacterium]